jgi:hypothetical protein
MPEIKIEFNRVEEDRLFVNHVSKLPSLAK